MDGDSPPDDEAKDGQGQEQAVRVPIDAVHADGGTQPRLKRDEETVKRYVEAVHRGDSFPPVMLFDDGSNYWLADGDHRLEAHRRARSKTINAIVRKGTRRDAGERVEFYAPAARVESSSTRRRRHAALAGLCRVQGVQAGGLEPGDG